jgi:hypothetical protein
MSDDDDDYVTTTPVGVRLNRLIRMRSGSLCALADCTLTVGDIELALHGVRVLRAPDGKMCAGSPMYRSQDGSFRPAIGIPKRLWNGIIELVVDEMDDACDPRNYPGGGSANTP